METPAAIVPMQHAKAVVRNLFLCHGGGPLLIFGREPELAGVLQQHVREDLPAAPSALIIVSAHYKKARPGVVVSPQPKMVYDYGGFPPEAYKLQYPAPGHPDLGRRIVERMKAVGLSDAVADDGWGYDHGTFGPLMVMYPHATIPVVPVSILNNDDDVARLFQIGEALQPFVDEGAVIIGSGSSFHSFELLRNPPRRGIPTDFGEALADVLSNKAYDAATRKAKLAAWRSLPNSYDFHPRGEADHFLPLLVCAAAAKFKPASLVRHFVETGNRLVIPLMHVGWE